MDVFGVDVRACWTL